MAGKPTERTVAIIPSAGMGRRMGAKKNYLMLLGKPVLAHTLEAFERAESVSSVILVAPPADLDFCREEIVGRYGIRKVENVVAGGTERQDSVRNGLEALEGSWEIAAVHDGARPLVTPEIIDETVRQARKYGGAIAAVPVKDTIKEASDGAVLRTVPRERLWAVQTPQAFRSDIILRAFEKALRDGFMGTDESSLVERLGLEVRIAGGSYENIKITTREDLAIAECILRTRLGVQA